MDNIDASISNIDASSKVLLKSVVQKLLPSLAAAPDSLDWNEIVLDNLWVDMKPEFSMSIVTPRNVFKSEFTIPQLLSTMTAADEVDCVIQPNKGFAVLNESEETELQKTIRIHNSVINGIVDEFSASMDDFKSGIAQEKVNSKKRKLNN